MPFLETSAKQSLNVDEAFVTMTKEIKDKNLKSLQTNKLTNSSSSLGQGRALEKPTDSFLDNDETPMNLNQM